MRAEPTPRRTGRLGRFRRWLRAKGPTSEGTLDTVSGALACAGLGFVPVALGPDLRRLTTFELCRLWRATDPVAHAATADELTSYVSDRLRLLGEFERRCPTGVAAWLASSDATSFDPRAYLVTNPVGRATIDWDELTRGQCW
jgi:hypothetical protein